MIQTLLSGLSSRVSSIYNPPPVTQTGWRYANAIDVKEIPNANLGDFIIDGPNVTSLGRAAIDMRISFNNLCTLGPGKKLLIKGGYYNYINIENPNINGGSDATKVVITNYFGQVRWGGRAESGPTENTFGIAGAKYFRLTGKYDPAAKTGSPDYRGHANGAYAYSSGTYGFWGTMNWRNMEQYILAIGGTVAAGMANFFEIDHCEFSDGGFGMSLKWDSPPLNQNSPMTFSFHDNYVHDVGGEGAYMGQNTNNGSHRFINTKVYNNRFVRVANELLQIGNFAEGCDIHNNVFLWGALAWKSPFQPFQDRAVQINSRGGEMKFRKNIVIGCSEYFIVLANDNGLNAPPDNAQAGQDIIIEDNVFYGSRKEGGYIFSVSDGITGYKIRRNWFHHFLPITAPANLQYTSVYPGAVIPANFIWKVDNTTDTIVFEDNKYPIGMTFCYNPSPNITQSGNTQIATPQLPMFVNNGVGDNFSYLNLTLWSSKIGEKAGFPSTGTNKGQNNVYNFGDYCMHGSALYRSNQDNNFGHEPRGFTDFWWTLIVFKGGSSLRPPDDLRLTSQDYYNFLGIGLLDNLLPNNVEVPMDTVEAVADVYMPTVFDPTEIHITAHETGANKIRLKIDYPTNILSANTRIVAIGSSTLAGSGATEGFKVYQQLEAWAAANITGGFIEIIAKPGTFSNHFVPDGAQSQSDWQRNVDAALTMDPDILIVSLPSNDPGEGNSNETFLSNLQLIYDKCWAQGVYCFITTTQPRNGYTIELQEQLRAAATLIKERFGPFAIDVFTPTARAYSPSGPAMIRPEYDANDTIHLNNAGATVVKNTMIATMQAYFINKGYTKFQVYRSTSPDSGYSLLLDNVGANEILIDRTDPGTYYYRVRAQRANLSYTGYSNVISVTQPVFAGEIIRTIQVNMGRSNYPGAIPGWNNWIPAGDIPSIGQQITTLNDSDGFESGIQMQITGAFLNSAVTGGRPSTEFPIEVIRPTWRLGEGSKAAIEITGLDPTLLYNFKMLSSTSAAFADYRYTGFTIGDRGAYVAANDPDPAIASNDGITADILGVHAPTGQVTLKIRALPNAVLGYLNTIQIEVMNSSNGVPMNAPAAIAEAYQPIVIGGSTQTGTVQVALTSPLLVPTPSSPSGVPGWNMIDIKAGVVYADLLTSDNNNTGATFSMTLVDINTIDNGSSYGGSVEWPLEIARYAKYRSGGPAMVGTIGNLNPNLHYTLKLFASRANNSTIMGYTVNGVTQTLAVNNNLTNHVEFDGVEPDVNGNIIITMLYTSGSTSVLNAFKLVIGADDTPISMTPPEVLAEVYMPDLVQEEIQAPSSDVEAEVYMPNLKEEDQPRSITLNHNYSGTWLGGLYLPPGFNPSSGKKYPFLIFLAGAGETDATSNLGEVTASALPSVLVAGDNPMGLDFSGYIIFWPHAKLSGSWGTALPKAAYDYVVNRYPVDLTRCYLTGLSLGAAGCMLMLQAFPDLFAAAIVYAGSQSLDYDWAKLRNIAMWSMHGTADNQQSPQNTIRLGFNSTNGKGMNVLNPPPLYSPLMSLFWAVGHGQWTERLYRRMSSTVSGTKALFNWDDWLGKYSTNLTTAAYGHVAYAEKYKTVFDFWNANIAVNRLANGADKTALQNRLLTLKATLYARIWVIDMGDPSLQSASPINNMTNINNGVTINNLIDYEGNASGLSYRQNARFSNWQPQTVHSNIMNGTYFGLPPSTNKDVARLLTTISNGEGEFLNLNNAKKYQFMVLHSMDNGDNVNGGQATCRVTVNGVSVSQYSQANTTLFINFDNITPASGALKYMANAPNNRDSGISTLILIEKP
jgi:hypothetical protein